MRNPLTGRSPSAFATLLSLEFCFSLRQWPLELDIVRTCQLATSLLVHCSLLAFSFRNVLSSPISGSA